MKILCLLQHPQPFITWMLFSTDSPSRLSSLKAATMPDLLMYKHGYNVAGMMLASDYHDANSQEVLSKYFLNVWINA